MNPTAIILLSVYCAQHIVEVESSSSSFDDIEEKAQRETADEHMWVQQSLIQLMGHLSAQCDTVVHFENVTGNLVGEFIYLSTQKYLTEDMRHLPTYTLMNYDVPKPVMKTIQDDFRYVVNIVYLSEPLKFSASMKKIVQTDDIVIVLCVKLQGYLRSCYNEEDKERSTVKLSSIIDDKILRHADSVYIIEITNVTMNVFRICYFCGEMSKEYRLVATNTPENLNPYQIRSLFRRKKVNFFGHGFRVAFLECNVGFSCINMTETKKPEETVTTCREISGVEGLMLKELTSRLNFTFELVTPKHTTGGPWHNLNIDVAEKRADWGIGYISVTYERSKIVSFSKTFGSDPLRLMYAEPEDLWREGLVVIQAFSLHTWLLLSATMLILTALLYSSDRIVDQQVTIKFSECFQAIFKIVVEQGIENLSSLYGRWLLMPWLLCYIIISTAYKGKLASSMINPSAEHPLNLDDLVNLGYYAYINKEDPSMVQTFLSNSTDPILQKMSMLTKTDLTVCEAAKILSTTKSFLVEEHCEMMFFFNKQCTKILTYSELDRIRLTAKTLLESGHAWPFKKKSPYLPTFDRYLSWIIQSGIYDKWIEKFTVQAGKNFLQSNGKREPQENKKMVIEAFFGPHLVLCIGLISSIICFVYETMHFTYQAKKQKLIRERGFKNLKIVLSWSKK